MREMKTVQFPFGDGFLELDLIRKADVFMPAQVAGVPDQLMAVRRALSQPIGSQKLSTLAQGKSTVAIVINDITRPAPTETMLTAIEKELSNAGINAEGVTVIVAVGNHEMPTEQELKTMMGIWYFKLNVVCHDCYDGKELTYVGRTKRGMPVWVNKHYADASVKILTGIITPHQSAGFSGGRKSVVPGIAGIQTLKVHHSFPIRPAGPVMGVIKDNSFHEEAVEGARLAGADFIVNVIKNYRGEVTDAVAGDLEEAHIAGVKICEKSWIRKVDKPYDVVIISPGGYPKDIDLHQSQKAVAVAEQVTKPGGSIVLVAECRKGIGKFGDILKRAKSVDAVIASFAKDGFSADHSSKAYMFARAARKHQLLVVTTGVPLDELNNMFMTGFSSLQAAADMVLKTTGNPSVLCIPYGVECIPVLG